MKRLSILLLALALGLTFAPPVSEAAGVQRMSENWPYYALSGADAYSRQALAITNAERLNAGLPPLAMDAELCRAARVRAEEITRRFAHMRPDGSGFATVCSGAFGENIARGQRSAERVMAAWLSSRGHRANILNPRYSRVGISAYRFNGVMHWVQLFGS